MNDTALIIVDMLNAFCKKDGSYQKRGNRLLNLDIGINNISIVLGHFRRTNRHIIFTIKSFKRDYSDIGLLGKLHPDIMRLNGLKEGCWDAQIIEDLRPLSSETVIVNNTYDVFYNTRLGDLLRRERINRLVVCGVVANICVQATLMGAFVRGIEPILVRECTTSTSNLLLDVFYQNVSNPFGWVTSTENILATDN